MDTPTNPEEQEALLRFERIERYILERMSAEERAAFEQELTHNAQLRDELEILRNDIRAVQLANIQEEIAAAGELYKINQSESEQHESSPVEEQSQGSKVVPLNSENGSSRRVWFAIAATIAALVGFFLLRPSAYSADGLYAKYHQVDPGLPTTMGITQDYQFQDAMVDFKYGRFEEAYSKWSDMISDNPASDTLQYYHALAALEANDLQMAQGALETLSSTDTAWRHKAQWYLVLCVLKADPGADLTAFEVDTDSPYRLNYEALLQEQADN